MKRKREKRWSDKRKREREGSIDARVETVKKTRNAYIFGRNDEEKHIHLEMVYEFS